MVVIRCIICNKQIEKSSYAHKNICGSECFAIDYWNDKVLLQDNPRVVRVNGEHYYIGKESLEKNNNNKSFNGFGGRKFVVKFFDGRFVKTTNLWHNGKIPKEFRKSLPDNAEFVEA